jgi:hypothetical protein
MPIFNCEFPLKVLRDLFRPPSVPDPEFTPFDLKALCGEHPEDSRAPLDNPIAVESEEYKKVLKQPEKEGTSEAN